MKKTFTCIICPVSCDIEVDYDGKKINKISGFMCNKGKDYVSEEIINPKRTLTTTILFKDELISIRTDKPIPKEKIPEVMELLKHIKLKSKPVHGQIIMKDIGGIGANIVVTSNS